MKIYLYVLLILVMTSACSSTEPPKVPIKEVKNTEVPMNVETVLKDAGGVIWSFVILPDGRYLLALREGEFKVFDPKTKNLKNVSGAPKVYADGQAGLLDLVLSPTFKNDKKIFYTYSALEKGGSATTLASATFEQDKITNQRILFAARPVQNTPYHFGSRIVFDGEGHLFVSIGERNIRNLAQDLSAHMGKIIRLNLDGSIPKDNPFVDDKKAKPEIWSYGHRNPQGLFFDKNNKKLWVNEHGPKGGDEINLVIKAANYGWPLATYGREYYGPRVSDNVTLPFAEDPRHVWLPSIAPSELIIYEGAAFPAWKGSFLSGALALTHLNRVEMKNDKSVKEERYLNELDERIRSIELDSLGNILVGTDLGTIFKLSPLTR